jgi:hypothetical protein
MAWLTLPDYFSGKIIKEEVFEKWSDEQLMKGYLIAFVDFTFPRNVKYPSIPVYIDKTTTVYPRKGTAYLTGPEYLLAKNQGCSLKLKTAFHISDKREFDPIAKKYVIIKPFYAIIKDIQRFRREYPKGHVKNLLYKEMGNSLYGNVVRGTSNKLVFDSQTGQTQRVVGTELSNPILASMTTAFVRSVIGECLHNIQHLDGKIVSVTTDGFITDIENLEHKLLKLDKKKIPLLLKYRSLREKLTAGDINPSSDAIELKTKGLGVIS